MKYLTKIMAVTLFLAGTLYPNFVCSGTYSEKYLGGRSLCLELSTLDETRVLDDQTILFKTEMGMVYISRLPAFCPGLKAADAFSYSTSINKLCKQDLIYVLEEGSSHGSVCGLGEFIRIKGVRNLRDTVKLLRGGVLDALIKEGAFKTVFP